MIKIMNKDALEISDDIPDNSIDLVLTSPPYGRLRNYKSKHNIGNYEGNEQVSMIIEIFEKIYRKVKDGGIVIIDVMDYQIKDSLYPYTAKIILEMRKIGYKYYRRIIWSKKATIGQLFPTNKTLAYKLGYEDIIIFVKNFMPIIPGRGVTLIEKSLSVYHDIPLIGHYKNHSAVMPMIIATRLIKMYSKKGGYVLEPFGGTGTTALASKMLGRNCYIYEVNPDYIKLIKERLSQTVMWR